MITRAQQFGHNHGYKIKSLYLITMVTIGMGQKWGKAAVGAGSPLGPHLTQCGLGRCLPLYQLAS